MSSPELQAVKNCAPKLELIFKSAEREVVHNLRREGFITERLHDNVLEIRSMLSEADKAGMLVEGIRDSIALDENRFHAFVAYLKTKGNYYSPIVKYLTDEFTRLGGVAPRPSYDSQSAGYPQQGGGHYREGPQPPPQATNASYGVTQHNGTGRRGITVVDGRHYGILMEQLFPCKTGWERIAAGLRFHSHEIEGIRMTPMNLMRGQEGCLGDMLGQWFLWAAGDARGSEGRATLEDLKTAVNRAGFPTVASSLILTERREP